MISNRMNIEDVNIEKLPTAVTANKYPVHKWFNFVAGYSPEYVNLVIENFLYRNKRMPNGIIDPFAGCGTTNVVANEMDIPSYGIERNPFFYKIGYTKSNADKTLPFVRGIADEFYEINNKSKSNISVLSNDAQKYLLKMYTVDDLEKLLAMRDRVSEYRDFKYYMGYTFLSKILEYVTNSKTDGIYKAPTSTKKSLSIDEAMLKAKICFLEGENDICESKSNYIYDSCIEYNFPWDNVDMVIFSPPYLNNFDFAEMTRLQMYFWNEAKSWREISDKHRNHMLVNTTTALKLVRSEEIQKKYKESLPKILNDKIEPIVNELERLFKEEKKSKDYYKIIYPYLGQMKIVLNKCLNSLNQNGEIHIVVSDAAFYGIHIDTQEYFKDLLLEAGVKDVNIIRMRDRGDRWILDKRAKSNKKLGEYEIIGYKES